MEILAQYSSFGVGVFSQVVGIVTVSVTSAIQYKAPLHYAMQWQRYQMWLNLLRVHFSMAGCFLLAGVGNLRHLVAPDIRF